MNKRVLLIGIAIEELEKKILSQLEHFHGPNLDLVPVAGDGFRQACDLDDGPSTAVIAIGNEQHIVGLVDHTKRHIGAETSNGLIRLAKFESTL